MFPFKKKRPTEIRPDPPGPIRQMLHHLSILLCNKLSQFEQRLSLPAKKTLVTLFCVIASLLAMNTLYQGLFMHSTTPPIFMPRPAVRVPVRERHPDTANRHRILHGPSAAPVASPLHDSITP